MESVVEPFWGWLVGRFTNPDEFQPIGHYVVRVDGCWHSAMSQSATTVCGRAVPVDVERRPRISTNCTACGETLFAHGQAVRVPWSVISELQRDFRRDGKRRVMA